MSGRGEKKIIKVCGDDFSITGDDHEEVFLTGSSLGQVLHDVPVALDLLLHLVSLSVAIVFLRFVLLFSLTVLFLSILIPVLLLLAAVLTNKRFCFPLVLPL